jgi:hypothetical protein
MSYKSFKNYCQWSGIGVKKAVSRAIAYKFKREVVPGIIVRETIGLVSRKSRTWPSPIPGLADYRGRRRWGTERASNPTLKRKNRQEHKTREAKTIRIIEATKFENRITPR